MTSRSISADEQKRIMETRQTRATNQRLNNNPMPGIWLTHRWIPQRGEGRSVPDTGGITPVPHDAALASDARASRQAQHTTLKAKG